MTEELTITAKVLCTNRHWAARQSAAQLSAEIDIPAKEIGLVLPPSPQRDPVWSGDERWRLVSAFALAQESLSGANGLGVLKNILSQYAPPDDAYSRQQIGGVTKLHTEVLFHPLRPSAEHPLGGLVRGIGIDMELDEDAFRGGSPFIFAGVLDVFMGLRNAINHVTRLRLFLRGHKGLYHQWPPRCGERPLL
jgi:type VI secretion system protein ImpG